MSVDSSAFSQAWTSLVERFNAEVSDDTAKQYFRFVNDHMETKAFLEAAQTIWATSRFFPRPADFLAVSASREWPLLQAAAEAFNPPHSTDKDGWDRLSIRSQEAVRYLGGILAVKEAMQRDPIRTRHEFFQAYDLTVAKEAVTENLLTEGTRPKQLAGGER